MKQSLDGILHNICKDMSKRDNIDSFRAKTMQCFHKIDGLSADEIEAIAKANLEVFFVNEDLPVKIVDVVLYGSRCRGLERKDSDLDILFEFESSEYKEDDLFNILCEEPFFICGFRVDYNPITKKETGTLDTYLPMAEKYLSKQKILYRNDMETARN